jgi:transposase
VTLEALIWIKLSTFCAASGRLYRLARRANALVLLDDGMSCEAIAKVLLLDDDTIRTWYRLYEEDGSRA